MRKDLDPSIRSSKKDINLARFAVGSAAVGLALKLGAPAKVESAVSSVDAAARALMNRGNTPAKVSTAEATGVAPDATIDYLKSLPTRKTEIPEGGGIDDAAYAVDPETFDESANLRVGVEDIISDQVAVADGLSPNTQSNFVVPAHLEVKVPVVPDINSVPKDAR